MIIRTASTSANIENNNFIDLASQVVGNSLTVTDSGPVDTDLNNIHLQDDTAGTSIAGTISNQQETSHISDDATESSVPGNTTLCVIASRTNPKNQWLAVTTLLVK